MTRENKLALVVGFGLVLFMGILVSDHYSGRNQVRHADLKDREVASLPKERNIRDRNPAYDRRLVSNPPIVSNQVTSPPAPIEPPVPPLDGPVTQLDQPRERDVRDIVQGEGGMNTANPLTQGAERTHIVQRGETLYRIAQQELGDGTQWKKIADANNLKDPGAISAGMKLRIPGTTGAVAQANEPVQPTSTESLEYTVRDGDTLSSIASQKLGKRGRWNEIYEMNRDRVKDPDSVAPGTVLKLPVAGASRRGGRA